MPENGLIPLEQMASRVELALRHAGVPPLARILENEGCLDIAAVTQGGACIVIRCVAERTAEDALALQTMVVQGPFERALLVSRGDAHASEGVVASCNIEGVDAALQKIVSEAGPWA